jgi:type IV pilus assembly protein PilM
MVDIPFLKKLTIPKFSLQFIKEKPDRVIGLDIGSYSAKVVQLKYEHEKARLETYGELLSERYFKRAERSGGGFLRYSDNEIVDLLRDLLHESEVTAKDAVIAVPAGGSFVVVISFPKISRAEIDQAMPYEARKYIPIPVSEVVLDWDVFESEEEDSVKILLVAVPRDIIEKIKRVMEIVGKNVRSIEIETFSMARALVGHDNTPTAVINIGYQTTAIAITDGGRLRLSYSIPRGSLEQTKAIERGLEINTERAEKIKLEVGLSDRPEEKEITSIIMPLTEILLTEIEKAISIYNRKAPRKIQKVNLTGGGANLKGLVDYASNKLGLEVTRGNPFAKIITPTLMQPVLREIGPSFSVAMGLALREIAPR